MSESQVEQLLGAALERLENPNRWTKWVFGRLEGNPAAIEYADCWCAMGALMLCARKLGASLAVVDEACDLLVLAAGHEPELCSIDQLNDAEATTHDDVLAWFVDAKAAAARRRAWFE